MDRGKQKVYEDEENLEEELEGFDDFTIASSWERFISEIEALCRLWLVDGVKNLKEKGAECMGMRDNLYRVKNELKYGIRLYSMEYYFEICNNGTGKSLDWDDGMHDLQLAFGVSDFLVIAPVSASGVVLDAPESCKLLSAVAIALSNCSSNWPAFVPVHDPSRKAYIGIQNMGMTFTRRFEADRIGSQVPVRLMHLEGLYELFVSKFALSSEDFSTSCFKVHFKMKLTYRTPPYDEEDEGILNEEPEVTEVMEDVDGKTHAKTQWDDDCPWSEWYSAEDPVTGFELTAIWSRKMFEVSLEMAELENASSLDADKWLLYPIVSPNITDDSSGKFVGFASQLRLLVSALEMSFEAQFLEDFLSAENPTSEITKSATTIPSPAATERVLKELFHDDVDSSDYNSDTNKNSRAIKGAPLESLFSQFCLHSLWFGNCSIHAIAVLWIEFVREVRWCWDESQPLPRMPSDSRVDLSTCLVHQKLQMLSTCIAKKTLYESHRTKESQDRIISENKVDIQANKVQAVNLLHKGSPDGKYNSSLRSDGHLEPKQTVTSLKEPDYSMASTDMQPLNQFRRGSAGPVGSLMLLHSFQKMHAPYTQDAPIMTEDMHEERLHAVEALGGAFSFSGQLERDILSSDMSAFKAANPDAVFEDFIRWHSPGDWEDDQAENISSDDKMESPNCNWPPRGKLSQRMSEHGNLWRQIWDESPALPISEQKPLLDPIREGEKILHYLETLRPHQLLEQMICTSFRASADTLSQTAYGDLKLLKTKVSQLYSTLASTLKPLQVNESTDKAELIGDLKQLCRTFEHIEKLITVAASIHRKLWHAPRLSKVIFDDYFNYYLPKMGTSLTSICYDKEFDTKELVMMQERDTVMNLFPLPTANQSWRRVLSMGNLLNGHEPVLREIIFSVYDRADDENSHYGSSISSATRKEIETHRMYISGTSNDLCVAHTVTSWD